MAQTLKFGNGTWATKKGSILAHNDEGGNFKPLPFTYTGAGKGTRVNKQGLIEVVENDRPRIDYTDSEDGVFLLEKAATNLIPYSEAFDNAYWTKSGASVTSGFVSPDGTNNAFKLVEDTSTGEHIIYKVSIGYTSGATLSYSFFAKKGERNVIQTYNYIGGGYVNGANFDLSTGIVSNEVSGSGTMLELDNGWYRCEFTSLATVGQSATNVAFRILNSADENNYTGDGTSGVYIWGSMLEQNSVASSYIPTQGTIQTRVQETASGSGNSEVFNSEQGVLFADIAGLVDADDYRIISLNAGNSTASIFLGLRNDTGNVYMYMPTDSTSYISNVNATNKFTKIALKYKTNDVSFFINGFKVFTDNTVTLPTGLNQLDFNYGNSTDSYPFYGKTKEISYYDEVLTDLELETLTSYRTWEAMVKELNLNIIHNE
jgi:hypothetical protein